MKIQLLGNLLEQKIHKMSAPGPQMQLGTPPGASRKMAAMFLIHLKHILLQLLLQLSLVQILGNHQEHRLLGLRLRCSAHFRSRSPQLRLQSYAKERIV